MCRNTRKCFWLVSTWRMTVTIVQNRIAFILQKESRMILSISKQNTLHYGETFFSENLFKFLLKLTFLRRNFVTSNQTNCWRCLTGVMRLAHNSHQMEWIFNVWPEIRFSLARWRNYSTNPDSRHCLFTFMLPGLLLHTAYLLVKFA